MQDVSKVDYVPEPLLFWLKDLESYRFLLLFLAILPIGKEGGLQLVGLAILPMGK
jgi:hypothetical protein